MSMKKINVVELYVYKRIEKLEKENGEYGLHTKVIEELKDVLDVIHQTHFKPSESDPVAGSGRIQRNCLRSRLW